MHRRVFVAGVLAAPFAAKVHAASAHHPHADRLAGAIAERYGIAPSAAQQVVDLARHYYPEDALLLLGLVGHESAFRPWVVGRNRDIGLAQVRADLWGPSEPELIRPEVNIATAARVLRTCRRRTGSVKAALGAYNGDRSGAYARAVLGEKRVLSKAA